MLCFIADKCANAALFTDVQIRELLCQLTIAYFPLLFTMIFFFFFLTVEYIKLLHETKKCKALFPIMRCAAVLALPNVPEMGKAKREVLR